MVCLDGIGIFVKTSISLRFGTTPPFLECGSGSLDGIVQIVLCCNWHIPQLFLCGGIDTLVVLCTVYQLAIDNVAVRGEVNL